MAESTIRLSNGQRWTKEQFVDHYLSDNGPVNVDKSWYMSDEGPGRFYHPGMFPIIDTILDNRKLAPGTYDLLDSVPDANGKEKEKDPSLSASLSNYISQMRSPDYLQRALVF